MALPHRSEAATRATTSMQAEQLAGAIVLWNHIKSPLCWVSLFTMPVSSMPSNHCQTTFWPKLYVPTNATIVDNYCNLFFMHMSTCTEKICDASFPNSQCTQKNIRYRCSFQVEVLVVPQPKPQRTADTDNSSTCKGHMPKKTSFLTGHQKSIYNSTLLSIGAQNELCNDFQNSTGYCHTMARWCKNRSWFSQCVKISSWLLPTAIRKCCLVSSQHHYHRHSHRTKCVPGWDVKHTFLMPRLLCEVKRHIRKVNKNLVILTRGAAS